MADRERIVSLIKTTYPFHKLDDNLIKLVVDNLEVATVSKGQTIYREGTLSDTDSLCIIFEGKVKLTCKTGEEIQTIGVLGEGELFGHEMLESNHHHPVSSIAETEVTLLKLNRVKANLLVEKIPNFIVALRLLMNSYLILLKHQFNWKGRDESIYYVAHRHPLWLWKKLPLPLFVMAFSLSLLLMTLISLPNAAAGFAFLMLVDILLGLLWIRILQFDWENDIVAITSHRVLFQERKLIFYETRVEAPLNAILSVATETTQLGRIMKYGNVIARTYAGSIYLPMLMYPEQVAAFLELQWGRSKSYRTRAEAASMENIVRSRIGYSGKGAPAGGANKPASAALAPAVVNGSENWLANLLQLKIETATGVIYKTHWIVLFQQDIIPVLTFLGVFILLLIVLFSAINFPNGPEAALTLSFLLFIVLCGVGFWVWYKYEDWANDIYIVGTDQIVDRVKKPFGKEDRKVAPLKNVQSVEFERGGIFGLVFNYGTVNIRVGESQMIFANVFNPADIQQEIFKRMAEREFKEKQTARETEQKWVTDWIAAYHRVVEQEKKTQAGSGFK